MESARPRLLPVLGAALLLLLLLLPRPGARAQEDAELQPRALDLYSPVDDASHEKELPRLNFGLPGGRARGVLQIEALQEVLKKLKSKRIPIYEKKYGQVPMCDAGEQCAVRKGARIGKLCDCPRGTSCNSFLLKCL
ncbi:cocaine- and amphetamine-regulated transcript protein isoform X1 [Dipodomys spectabilis]|uniref:cocaine- and amphetamine-regulated transcript protein isoform X1 n=1 Tax=Dipodomys spectabilis TaxID=105255 RepID=UPI001C546676|nr:cocaine- and amphetamine-regulated transcript protein isoform X1 [Dipodomys spectabilis]